MLPPSLTPSHTLKSLVKTDPMTLIAKELNSADLRSLRHTDTEFYNDETLQTMQKDGYRELFTKRRSIGVSIVFSPEFVSTATQALHEFSNQLHTDLSKAEVQPLEHLGTLITQLTPSPQEAYHMDKDDKNLLEVKAEICRQEFCLVKSRLASCPIANLLEYKGRIWLGHILIAYAQTAPHLDIKALTECENLAVWYTSQPSIIQAQLVDLHTTRLNNIKLFLDDLEKEGNWTREMCAKEYQTYRNVIFNNEMITS